MHHDMMLRSDTPKRIDSLISSVKLLGTMRHDIHSLPVIGHKHPWQTKRTEKDLDHGRLVLDHLAHPPLSSVWGVSELGKVAKEGFCGFNIVGDARDGLGTTEAYKDEKQADKNGAYSQTQALRRLTEQVNRVLQHL